VSRYLACDVVDQEGANKSTFVALPMHLAPACRLSDKPPVAL